jgi:carbamoyl-phosphate synthase large subunit
LADVKSKAGLDFLLPCLDAELPLMIRFERELARMGIATFLPTEGQFELRSKDRLMELSQRLECQYPETRVVYSIDELVKVLSGDIELPAIVKGKYYKAYLVYNLDTAVLKGSEIAAEWGFPLLVQKRVSGQEINLIGLADGEGAVLGRVSMKKQLTTSLGKVWTGVTIQDDRLDSLCDTFCRVTGWRGPFELECIRTADGICLIEINPRFPAWLYFATAVGMNLPKMLIDFVTSGARPPRQSYPVGKYLVRQTTEFVTDLKYFQNLLTTRNREGT